MFSTCTGGGVFMSIVGSTLPFGGVLLHAQCVIPLEPFELASLFRSELVCTEVDYDLVERATELEWHFCVVFVDNWRTGVLTNVEALIEREPQRLGQQNATLCDLLAVDGEHSISWFTRAATVVGKIETDRVLARRDWVRPHDAKFVLFLVRIFIAILVRERIGKHRFGVE